MVTEISVVIPAHNESGNIERLVKDTYKILSNKKIEGEIIVIDDNSTDNTLKILKNLQKEITVLKIIYHEKNCGQSRSLLTGIRAAKNPIIVTMDGDYQNDPNDIPKLLQILKEGEKKNIKMVVGHRKKRQDSVFKKIASKYANKIRIFLLKDDTPDTGCGLKAFYREDFLKFPYFDHMHRFLPALMKREGGEVVSVEVNHKKREYGKSHYNNFQRAIVGIVDLLGVMWLQRRTCNPSFKEIKKDAI